MDIVVFGSRGHAESAIDVIEEQGVYTIVGLIDDTRQTNEETRGYKIIGKTRDLKAICGDISSGIVCVGDNRKRHLISLLFVAAHPAFNFITAVHPKACVSRHAVVGAGSVIMAGAVVNSGCLIGNHCIVNTSASIDHHCKLADFASVAPGGTLGGNVTVGACSAIGLGAAVRERVTIGDHAVVGAGALVLDDLPSRVVAYGVPVSTIRARDIDQPYTR
jgi:sugar O-acyltransferase (sialic acid O-acetyltransferase NeuD family)